MIDKRIILIGKEHLGNRDFEFFQRVYSSDLDIYLNRVKAVDFVGMDNVLDAGCGMGQWSLMMAKVNNHIYSIDNSYSRINVVSELAGYMNVKNISPSVGDVGSLKGFEDCFFDAVFCYSVFNFTNYYNCIREFARVLKPGGRLYATANGLGWYINMIVSEKNKTMHYDPRMESVEIINTSLNLFSSNSKDIEGSTVIPKEHLLKLLMVEGFDNVICQDEGAIQLTEIKPQTFYSNLQNYGMENVYEVVARKATI